MVKFIKSTKNNMKFIDSNELYKKLLDQNSLLVKIHDLVDFEYYRPMLENLYSDLGRGAHDCILMFKIQLLQYLEGMSSERDLIRRINTNIEYRYFLDLCIDDVIPHFTKIGDFKKRLGEEKFEELFTEFVNLLRNNNIITSDDIRFMDATHQLADVSQCSINTLLAKACKELIEQINKHIHYKPKNLVDLDFKEINLSETDKKKRFVNLVNLGIEIQNKAKELLESANDKILKESYGTLCRIIKERSKEEDGTFVRKDSNDKGKLASLTDKDCTWGSKSKKKQFLGYKHNITMTESGFIEVISTHKGHKADESFYLEDAKKTTCKKIVCDNKYGTLDNRSKSKEKLKINLVAPVRSNMKSHLKEPIMDEALIYKQAESYNKEMKKRGSLIEGLFGVMKRKHNFGRAKVRGLKKVIINAFIASFSMNLKALVKWYLATAINKT
jgi:hypothetical protein